MVEATQNFIRVKHKYWNSICLRGSKCNPKHLISYIFGSLFYVEFWETLFPTAEKEWKIWIKKKKTSKNCYLLTEQAASLHTGLHRLDKLFQVSIELLLFALYHTVFDARMIYQLCRIELIDNFPILKTFLRKDKFW